MRLICLSALLCLCLGAAEPTRYVLAPSVLQCDPAPRVFRSEPELAALGRMFQSTFEASFPEGHVPLSLEHMLDPDQPTLLVVPRLSAVRLNLDTVAGSLERYEAVIVGDITLMDPWTLTRLYAATKMVTRTVELSRDRSVAEKREFLQKAFLDATQAWIREGFLELQKGAHPFTLKGAILADPGVSLRGGGGIWPYGRRQGVKPGTLVMASGGKTARVRELADNFCVLEDPADPTRGLKASEAYHVTLVGADNPGEREEPRLAIRWVGAPMTAPADTGDALSEGGWSGLLANYLSKGGRLRILPGSSDQEAAAWKRMTDKLRTFSLRADAMATQDITAMLAAEDPDLVLELGLVNAYHGQAAGENGGTDHTFRVQWGLRWFERDAERRVLVFKGAEFITEQSAVRSKRGLRELDLGSVWFNLCRNGIIRAAESAGKRLHPAERTQTGLGQGGGKIAWTGAPPPAGARLTWRRNEGRVMAAGKDLGVRWSQPKPLGPQDLAKVGRGDEVQYDPGSCGPLAGLLPVDLAEGPLPISSPWLQARLATLVNKSMNVDLVFTEGAPCPQWLRLKVDAVSAQPEGAALKLGATWRLRLYRGAYDPNGEPAFKLGLQHALSVPVDAQSRPLDAGPASFAYQGVALEELVKRATTQGLPQALSQGD